MAAITFNNFLDPNPGFEEILDPGGTLAGNATVFAITNNTGGSSRQLHLPRDRDRLHL